MYIIKNAFRCIARAKGRNFLIGVIVLLLSVSSCIGLSIKQANRTLKKQYADNMEISATLNPTDMRQSGSISIDTLKGLSDNESVKNFYYSSSIYFAAGDDIKPLDVSGSFKQNKDFREEFGDIKNGQETTSSTADSVENTSASDSYKIITLANVNSYTEESLPSEPAKDGDNDDQDTDGKEQATGEENKDTQDNTPPQNEDNIPQRPNDSKDDSQNFASNVPNSDQSSDDSNNRNQENQHFPQGGQFPQGGSSENGGGMGQGGRGGDTFITNKFFFNMASLNDFTVIGYGDSVAVPEYISSLGALNLEADSLNCVISKNLAEENEFETGDTFTLKNPDNSDEVYKFTIVGICDTSMSDDKQDTSSNASFTDNYIYVSGVAVDKILSDSANTNTSDGDSEESAALTASYSGTFVFANLTDYNSFSETVGDDYRLVSQDISNYEESISQLETLGKYATYFLIVIFIIGAFVLVTINLFSIRNRKYEIGVLTAIGMKKYKVALQFVIELFAVTFIAIIIGSCIGAATSVPVTNSLLVTINSEKADGAVDNLPSADNRFHDMPDMGGNMPNGGFKNRMESFGQNFNNYVASVSSATDVTVILQMILVGLALTLISSAAAVTFVMRYEPLKILNNRD